MKKIIGFTAILTAVLFLGGCSLYGSTPSASPAPAQPETPNNQANTVSIKNFAFNPAELAVKAGDTVTWINNEAAPHQIKADAFNSEALSQGQSFSFAFTQPGTYNYICSIHPAMAGKIIVE